MSDKKDKPSIQDKLKEIPSKLKGGSLNAVQKFAQMLSKLLKTLIWNPITIGLLMLFIGARMHETGFLAGSFNKSLKGATVRISGKCIGPNKQLRVPTLAEDQVKITYIDEEKIQAVVRKTREVVECRLADVAIDSMPLLAYLGTDMTNIPELTMPVVVNKGIPAHKSLEKKTLLMSGICKDMSGNDLPSFTDEPVDVTSTSDIEGNDENFSLMGIKKVDKVAIQCISSQIKYSEYQAPKAIITSNSNLEQTQEKTYVGDILVITGTCFPDERTKANKTKKYLFYKLANSKVQILENDIDKNGKITRLIGTVLDQEFRGDAIYCDKVKFPFIYQEYNDESMNLDKGVASESEPDQASTQVTQPTTNENI